MISTLDIKKQQLTNGAFRTGNGKEVILIMGSCRSLAYLNYLNDWNNLNLNRFTIYFIDPFNWNWNIKDERVDYITELEKLEKNDVLLTILSSVDIFIHEYYKNYGMFNIDKGEKNIYDFGMNPSLDICIPNFNDFFILFNDVVNFDSRINTLVQSELSNSGELKEETEKEIYKISQDNLEKFYAICRKSNIPEMEDHFKSQMKNTRFFWTSNHISKHFSLSIFRFLNDKFLKLELSDAFWKEISKEDIYANNYTYLTKYDLKYYGFEWGEEIKELTIK